tara:strand:- start:75 stop:563 length:489 start_codon:yes stop_codon:yes gene_type:complete
MDPQMADVVCAFIPNLLNYTIILATHLSMLDDYSRTDELFPEPTFHFVVGGDHIEMAAEIIYDLYEELVTWLESEVQLEKEMRATKTRIAAWKSAWSSCKLVSVEGKQGDWARKSEIMSVYAKQNGGVSKNTQFNHYNQVKKDLFGETALGVTKYVQLNTQQ